VTGEVLTTATRLLADMQFQLEAESYPPTLVRVALERARGTAAQKARPIRASSYDDAFIDLLVEELKGVRDWLDRQGRFFTE